ncbi:MAG: hybrid sensor histidine kinase/response regulator [Opitutales bacterium]|nr:hybrid sensor histidine kinase/response regulator [Opitutales bacterium]
MQKTDSPVVLLVDDTVTNLQLLSDYLSDSNYRILTALNGEKALERLDLIIPDIILLDVMMPRMDGFEVCSRIKAQKRLLHVPVIFMTALADVQSKVKAFSVGAVDYIEKPVQKEEALARIKTHLEIHRLQQNLEAEIVEKEHMIEELDAYAHTVAHNLKNPLLGIQSLSDLLVSEDASSLPEDIKECLQTIHQSSAQVNNIINELLLLAQCRGAQVAFAPLNIPQILQNALNRLRIPLQETNGTVTLMNQWPSVNAYGPWIEEVFYNLISNAIKYGGQPPSIEVGASVQEKNILFWVKDNGPGIPLEKQKLLFQPFGRLSSRPDSTGLGLSIVRRIIDRFNGKVYVESAEGQGTSFFFLLPRS